MFQHQSAALFYHPSCLSESSFEATVLALHSPQDGSSVLLYSSHCPDGSCITCLDVSCLWAVPRANVQSSRWGTTRRVSRVVNAKTILPFFCTCKSVVLILPCKPIDSLFGERFSRSSVITVCTPAVMSSTSVGKNALFLPVAREEFHLQPSLFCSKSFSMSIKMVNGFSAYDAHIVGIKSWVLGNRRATIAALGQTLQQWDFFVFVCIIISLLIMVLQSRTKQSDQARSPSMGHSCYWWGIWPAVT